METYPLYSTGNNHRYIQCLPPTPSSTVAVTCNLTTSETSNTPALMAGTITKARTYVICVRGQKHITRVEWNTGLAFQLKCSSKWGRITSFCLFY